MRLYPHWHNYKLDGPEALALIHAATERGLAITIPVRVEDRRQQSWLVDIPDVSAAEIAAVVKAAPQARFIVMNGPGLGNSILGQRDNTLPPNYAIDISLLTVELSNEVGRLLQALGEDRVVFGTGIPFHYADPALTKLAILDAPPAVKEKIRSGNARRILGL